MGSRLVAAEPFRKLMKIYADNAWLLDTELFTARGPLDLVGPRKGVHDLDQLGWHRGIWEARSARYYYLDENFAKRRRFFYLSDHAMVDYEVDRPNVDVFYQQLGAWLTPQTIVPEVARLLRMTESHMKLLGLGILSTSRDMRDLSLVLESMMNFLVSRQTELRMATLRALNAFERDTFDPQLTKCLISLLLDDEVPVREGAWQVLQAKGFV
jgi:hypothetical protein